MRMLLVIPIVISLRSEDFLLALVLIFIAGLSDGLDGYLAKRFDWRTRLGGLLDPLADKLLLVTVILTLTFMNLTPIWLACVVIGRDLIIITGAILYNYLIGPVTPDPSVVSKINTICQLLYIIVVILRQASGWPPEIGILLVTAAVLFTSLVNGIDYVIRWGRTYLQKNRVSDNF
jgi:cardiolipin synthase (CMP-forming)